MVELLSIQEIDQAALYLGAIGCFSIALFSVMITVNPI